MSGVRTIKDPQHSVKKDSPTLEKPFTIKEGEKIQLRIKRVWDLIEEVEAETKRFKETMQYDSAALD